MNMNKSQQKQEILTIQKKLAGKWANFYNLVSLLSWMMLCYCVAKIIVALIFFYPFSKQPSSETILFWQQLSKTTWFSAKLFLPIFIIVSSIDIYYLYLAKQAWIKQQPVK